VAAEVFLPQADQMRIPIEYLAQLFAAGDQAVIRRTLQRLSAVRVYMNAKSCGEAAEPSPDSDLTAEEIEAMFHLLAVAKLRDRFVVPAGCEREQAELCQARGTCGFPGEKE
jgi:Nitrate reductase beta subunit